MSHVKRFFILNLTWIASFALLHGGSNDVKLIWNLDPVDPPPEFLWIRPTPYDDSLSSAVNYWISGVLLNEYVLAKDNAQQFVLLDRKTGSILWKRVLHFDEYTKEGKVLVDSQRVYLVLPKTVVALDLASGIVLWSYKISQTEALLGHNASIREWTATQDKRYLYVGKVSTILKLQKDTGKAQAHLHFNKEIVQMAYRSDLKTWYVALSDGSVAAYQGSQGLWKTQVLDPLRTNSANKIQPLLFQRKVLVVPSLTSISFLLIKNGELIQRFPVQGEYFTSLQGQLYGIRPQSNILTRYYDNFRSRWSIDLPELGQRPSTSLPYGNTSYLLWAERFASFLYLLDKANGDIMFTWDLLQYKDTSPHAILDVDGSEVLWGGKHNLYLLDLSKLPQKPPTR